MLYLFLDESGDLGFDFAGKKPSDYFVVTILAVKSESERKKLAKAVERTLRNKLKGSKRKVHELKGSLTSFPVKWYFYEKARGADFQLFALVLPKKKLLKSFVKDKSRVYNYLARKLLKALPLEHVQGRLIFILDRSKKKAEIKEFNEFIYASLRGHLPSGTLLDIHHFDSQSTKELQATDLFAWGIYRKYELADTEWYDCFKDHILVEFAYK